MKIAQRHLTILKKISDKPKTLHDLMLGRSESQKILYGNVNKTSILNERYLMECQQLGYALQIGELWHITKDGLSKLDIKPEKITGRICAMSMTDSYDGAELRNSSVRPGAYTFLSWPSLINSSRVYRKDANA